MTPDGTTLGALANMNTAGPNFAVSQAKPGPYLTRLAPVEEMEFRNWVAKSNVPWQDTPASDYDMRGYWQALKNGDPRAVQAVSGYDGKVHLPDNWKTPNHKTFSNESIYALPTAPSWQGDRLVSSLGGIVADETPKPAAKKK